MILTYDKMPVGFKSYFSDKQQNIEQSLLTNPFAKLLCYTINKQIVGYLLYSHMYERIEIEQLEVYAEFRRQKIASHLLSHLIEMASDAHVVNITLEVRQTNDAAIHLYEKFDFKKQAMRYNYYQNEHGTLMMKTI